jgi:N-acetylglucosaminyl-diphospho-decaprenol L-rhamnosyltransferase
MVGPRIFGKSGDLYPSARRFPHLVEAFGHGVIGQFWPGNPFTRRYRMVDWDHAGAREVDWVSGACFLARREAWDAVGGFDRTYFMYMEDVDLCWRLRAAGWSVAYEPAAEVVHIQGVSADRHPYRMLLAHHVSMWRFACRTTTGRRRWALPFVLVGLALRLCVTVTRRGLAGRFPARARKGRPTPSRAGR